MGSQLRSVVYSDTVLKQRKEKNQGMLGMYVCAGVLLRRGEVACGGGSICVAKIQATTAKAKRAKAARQHRLCNKAFLREVLRFEIHD